MIFREIRYETGTGKEYRILTENGIMIKEANFHAYEWEPLEIANRYGATVSGFQKDPARYAATLCFQGTEQERRDAIEEFHAQTERDIINKTPGKLYFGLQQYLECYVISSETYPTEDGFWTYNDVTFYAPYPFWIIDYNYLFPKKEDEGGAAGGYLEYPFDYSYDYTGWQEGYSRIRTGHYAPSTFTMTIYGPVSDPVINIGGQTYGLFDTIQDGEYVVIDSRYHTITKYLTNGTQQNLYDKRMKQQSIFAPIPPGTSLVRWSGSFGFDVTVHIERSEPKWNEFPF